MVFWLKNKNRAVKNSAVSGSFLCNIAFLRHKNRSEQYLDGLLTPVFMSMR